MRLALLGAVLALLSLPGTVQAQAPTETIEYYATDAIGSVRVVFGANGAVLGRQDYGPFGSELLPAPTLPPEGFGGQEKDTETDQGYFHARQYQSRTGRFTRVDPIYAGLFEPQRLNRYSYALNNPLAYVDPQGLSATLWQCVEYPGVCLEDIVDITRAGPLPAGGGPGGGRGGGGGGNQKPPPPVVVNPDPPIPPTTPTGGDAEKPEGCPAVPLTPSSVSLRSNMQVAQMHRTIHPERTPEWFYGIVKSNTAENVLAGQSWDYKAVDSRWQEFGNFNYGATGQRAGFSRLALALGSIGAHIKGSEGSPLAPKNVRFELEDQLAIQRGFTYAAKNCQ